MSNVEPEEETLALKNDCPRKGLERMLDPFGFPIDVDGDNLHFTTRDRLDIEHLYASGSVPEINDPTLDTVAFRLRMNGVEKKMTCVESETPGWYVLSTFAHESPVLDAVAGSDVRIEISATYKYKEQRVVSEKVLDFLRGSFLMPASYVGFGGVPVFTFMPTNECLITCSVGCKRADGTPIITHVQCNFKL